MSLFKRKAVGGLVPSFHAQGSGERVAIRLSDPEAVVPDAVLAHYGRDFLERMTGGRVFSASEMLAAYDGDDT